MFPSNLTKRLGWVSLISLFAGVLFLSGVFIWGPMPKEMPLWGLVSILSIALVAMLASAFSGLLWFERRDEERIRAWRKQPVILATIFDVLAEEVDRGLLFEGSLSIVERILEKHNSGPYSFEQLYGTLWEGFREADAIGTTPRLLCSVLIESDGNGGVRWSQKMWALVEERSPMPRGWKPPKVSAGWMNPTLADSSDE